MKHIKNFEASQISPQVGDYVKFKSSAFKTSSSVYNCAKIVEIDEATKHIYKVTIIKKDKKNKSYILVHSALFKNEIVGFASQEEIDFFKLYENINKYNL